MIEILVAMAAGITVGYLLRSKEQLFVYADKIVMVAIFLLLFVLGISVGINKVVVNNLHVIGLKALVLALSAVFGSVFLSWGLYLGFFRGEKR